MLNFSLYAHTVSLPVKATMNRHPRQRGKLHANREPAVSETQDRSFAEDANPGRVPLKAVNINDDSAEITLRLIPQIMVDSIIIQLLINALYLLLYYIRSMTSRSISI